MRKEQERRVTAWRVDRQVLPTAIQTRLIAALAETDEGVLASRDDVQEGKKELEVQPLADPDLANYAHP